MLPNQLISSHSDDGQLHQPARSATPTAFAFSLQGIQSALHSRKRTSPFRVGLGADIWGFRLFPASRGIFHISLTPWSYEFPNNRSSIDKAHITCSQFHIQQSYTKKRQRPLQVDFPSSAETLSSLMPSVKLEILAHLLHICCASILKAKDGTGKIRGYDGRRTAINNRLFFTTVYPNIWGLNQWDLTEILGSATGTSAPRNTRQEISTHGWVQEKQ